MHIHKSRFKPGGRQISVVVFNPTAGIQMSTREKKTLTFLFLDLLRSTRAFVARPSVERFSPCLSDEKSPYRSLLVSSAPSPPMAVVSP